MGSNESEADAPPFSLWEGVGQKPGPKEEDDCETLPGSEKLKTMNEDFRGLDPLTRVQ